MTDATRIAISSIELAAVVQLHLWLADGLAGVYQAFAAGDHERAAVLVRLLFEHEHMQRDMVTMTALVDRVFPALFGVAADDQRVHQRRLLAELTAEVLGAPARPGSLPS